MATIAYAEQAGEQQISAAVGRVRAAFDAGLTRPLAHRQRQLDGILALLDRHESDLADALSADVGRNSFDSFTLDTAPTRIEATFARRRVRRWLKPKRVPMASTHLPGRAEVRREPLGVVAVVGAWNYPVYLCLAPVVAAVAAGNAVVIKPSEWAPATAALLADLVPRHLDPESVAVLVGGHEVTTKVIESGIDHLFFTGGTAAGDQLRVAAARHGVSVTLELGGKCPAIVAADADLEVAARRIASVALWNGGQTCVRPDHVLVEVSVRDEFLDQLVAATRRFAGAGVQPLLNSNHVDRVQRLLADHDGRVAHGGGIDVATRMVEPTIIVDPAPASALLTEEVFAPILPVVSVASSDEAIAGVAGRPAPLAIYLFTGSRGLRNRVLAGTRSGSVVVNDVAFQLGNPHLPFGGVGQSGSGVYHGRWGFDTLTQPRAVLSRTARPDLKFRYPPFSESAQRLIRRLL